MFSWAISMSLSKQYAMKPVGSHTYHVSLVAEKEDRLFAKSLSGASQWPLEGLTLFRLGRVPGTALPIL